MTVAVPVRVDPGQVRRFWSAVAVIEDALTRLARHTDPGPRGEAVRVALGRVSGSLAELVAAAVAAGMPPRDAAGGRVDRGSARWETAVHEAGHAVTAQALGARSEFVGVTGPDTGLHRLGAGMPEEGPARAITAVAGERATRLLLGRGGGSGVDYRTAIAALRGTGWDLARAETAADGLIRVRRRDLERLATRIYRRGRVDHLPATGPAAALT